LVYPAAFFIERFFMNTSHQEVIKIIIGLGNPGKQFHRTRHNIGFLVLDALAQECGGAWEKKGEKEIAECSINGTSIILVKPLTFMNSSGKVIPSLLKQGVTAKNLLVIHDELEKPFGAVDIKNGGSHKGHNGLRSLIEFCGPDFMRIRCGIGRPVHKEDVGTYVLSAFTEKTEDVENMITIALENIYKVIKT